MSKKLKDRNAPKRPLTSYILFGNDLRENDEKVRNLQIKEQAAEIATRWREADEATKEKYTKEANRLRDEYLEKRKEYEQTDEYKEFLKSQKDLNKKGPKRKAPVKVSGYRLFIMENNRPTEEDSTDPELAGKGHMARCGIKWSRLSEEEKGKYNSRAAEMIPGESANNDDE